MKQLKDDKTMQRSLLILLALAFSCLLHASDEKPGTLKTGSFGVGKDDPAAILLILRDDHTFYFQDYSRLSRKISNNGTWQKKGRKTIVLSGAGARSFHNRWKISTDGLVARSRHGLCFYRICRISDEH